MAIVDTGLEGPCLRGRLDFEPGPSGETGRKSHQAVEWKLTKVTCCEPDEDVKPTYGKKCLLSERGAFFPLREGTVGGDEGWLKKTGEGEGVCNLKKGITAVVIVLLLDQ